LKNPNFGKSETGTRIHVLLKGKVIPMRKKRLLAALLCAMLLLLTACGLPSAPQNEKLQILCTIFPQYDFARRIAGEYADIRLLLPPGVESHRFEPLPQDMIAVRSCDLLIRVDAEMEIWSQKILSSLESPPPLLDLAQECGLEIVPEHEHTHDEHEHSADECGIDPHIWTSLRYARRMAAAIAARLCELDTAHAAQYRQNAAALDAELAALDADFAAAIQTAKRKTIVFGSSFALQNFVLDYGLGYLAAFDSCGEYAEPSFRAAADLTDKLRGHGIPVIFKQEIVGARTAQNIAAETGAQVRLFHTCHNLTRTEMQANESYLSLMRQNLENLKIALN